MTEGHLIYAVGWHTLRHEGRGEFRLRPGADDMHCLKPKSCPTTPIARALGVPPARKMRTGDFPTAFEFFAIHL